MGELFVLYALVGIAIFIRVVRSTGWNEFKEEPVSGTLIFFTFVIAWPIVTLVMVMAIKKD